MKEIYEKGVKWCKSFDMDGILIALTKENKKKKVRKLNRVCYIF